MNFSFILRCTVAAWIVGSGSTRLPGVELEPIGPGPFAVACTNLEVTVTATTPMFEYLNGQTTKEGTKYITDLLTHPDAVPTVSLAVPAEPARYGARAGQRLPLVLLVVYPTTADNPRPDYRFPYKETGDAVFSHMHQPGDRPLLADPSAKYPVIFYSGGLNTHGLWHLSHLKTLASHGYIVVDLFHGDGRGAGFVENMALRSLQLRAAVDFMLQSPEFGPAIDANRLGVDGASAGGHTVAAALGGLDPLGRIPVGNDPRIKAGFALVPFFGGSFGFWPFKVDAWFFGENYAGLNQVRRPFLALYAGNDGNVPPEGVEAGLRAMRGPTIGIKLPDETHSLSDASGSDVHTWELLFFNAWLRDDAAAREKLAGGTSVRGGVNDSKSSSHGL